MREFNQMTLNYGEEFQAQLNDKKQKVKIRPSAKIKPILKASINQLEDKKFSVDLDVENMVEEDLLPPPLKCPEGYTITAEDGIKYYCDRGVETVSECLSAENF